MNRLEMPNLLEDLDRLELCELMVCHVDQGTRQQA